MRVLVSGGGTGGHIYPALSLMNYLKEQDPSTEFLYVETERGLESTIVPPPETNTLIFFLLYTTVFLLLQ